MTVLDLERLILLRKSLLDPAVPEYKKMINASYYMAVYPELTEKEKDWIENDS
jgi:hypothetical protein